jgi:Ala-tRNA(Pro) deacylase
MGRNTRRTGNRLGEIVAMAMTRPEIEAVLGELGIPFSVHEHPPLMTVADSQALRGAIPGTHTKNLFLRDRKDRLFLVSVDEDAEVDLKTIHARIGAAGRVSFGKAETLFQTLGVQPGAVTLLGAVNDVDRRVTIVIDEALLAAGIVNVHPLTNDATLSLAPGDLMRFLAHTGHEPLVLKIGQ